MARNTQLYDQNTHALILDGHLTVDLFDGSSFVFAIDGDDVQTTRGTDRNSISFGSGRTAMLTVTLKPTSPSIDFYLELSNSARNGRARVVNALLKTGVDDAVTMTQVGVQESGFNTGGSVMEARTFILKAANYEVRA